MTLLIKLIAALIAIMGFSLLVYPAFLFDFMERHQDSLVLYLSGTAIRIIVGILLIKAAPESRYPVFLRVLGFLFILIALTVGLFFVVMERETVQGIITAWVLAVKPFAALIGIAIMIFGGFLIYAVSGKRKP